MTVVPEFRIVSWATLVVAVFRILFWPSVVAVFQIVLLLAVVVASQMLNVGEALNSGGSILMVVCVFLFLKTCLIRSSGQMLA